MIDEREQVNRREFLAFLTWMIGGLISAGMAIPAVAYLLGPALRRQQERGWVPLGLTSKVELRTPTLFQARVERKTGWIEDSEKITVYVLTDDGRGYLAMSNVCTHLGCRVRWIADQQQFFCPCHNGVFDRQGRVVAGPPPRPLDRYEVRIEGEQIYIGELKQVGG